MKKTAAGAAIAAGIGLSILSASPAMAAVGPFANCQEAADAGYTLMPVGAPGYAPQLDSDNDGIACNGVDIPFTVGPNLGAHASADYFTRNQISQVPVGAPDTGVPTDGAAIDSSFLLAAGAMVITVGAAAAARRRTAVPTGDR
ncbi:MULTISPECIES: excalibur calcium-binding domain-containing protein [Arthrobacter]|nr:excalibur calcium-binding domain-containing protein [Arthrobacter citreus]